MAYSKVYGQQAFQSSVKKLTDARRKKFAKILDEVVTYIFNHTPVWSGNTLANYHFSSTKPSYTYVKKGPFEEGVFGEENREAAERIARSSYSRTIKDPDRPFYISNNTVYEEWRTGNTYTFEDFDNGLVSKRVPIDGIFQGAEKLMIARLRAFG